MLSVNAITAWGVTHPWATADQIEQDLLLSRAICEIANHPYLSAELLFRGGTALHKLHLPQPARYSEDLDYVRTTAGGIATLTRTLCDLGQDLSFQTSSRITEHPKVYWRTTSQADNPLRIKIEINTHERTPALPTIRVPFNLATPWWSGNSDVPTFQLAELIATKMRALYQRSKGRDLFDIWLALTQTDLSPEQVLAAFETYRPRGYSSIFAVNNLDAKLADPDFRHDLDQLIAQSVTPYDPDDAGTLVKLLLLESV